MFEFNVKIEMPEIPAPRTETTPATQSGYAAAVLDKLARKQYAFTVTGNQAITAIDPAGATDVTCATITILKKKCCFWMPTWIL